MHKCANMLTCAVRTLDFIASCSHRRCGSYVRCTTQTSTAMAASVLMCFRYTPVLFKYACYAAWTLLKLHAASVSVLRC